MDGDQLRTLISEHKETQVNIAGVLDVHPTAISKVLKGSRQLKAEEVDKLRRYFGLKVEALPDRTRQLPIVGLIAAGSWREGFESVMGYMPSPDPKLSSDAFVVIVEGDSMDKVAKPGEAIIIEPQDRQLISGAYYVVRNGDGESTFKRYLENPARLEPCSHNSDHCAIMLGEHEFTVIGRARKKVTDL